jgi:hypothetical protein
LGTRGGMRSWGVVRTIRAAWALLFDVRAKWRTAQRSAVASTLDVPVGADALWSVACS